jgi:hypothetical protein
MTRVLLVGLPRSGTTWLANVLTAAEGSALNNEPDNHWMFPFAFRAKRGLPGRFHPLLDPEAEPTKYEELWRQAFGLGNGTATGFSTRERARERVAMRLLRLFDRGSDAERSRKAFMRHMHPGLLPPHLALAEMLAVPRRPACSEPHILVKSVYASLSVEWIAARLPVRVIVLLRSAFNVLSSWKERGWLGEPGDDMLDEVDRATQHELSRSSGIPIPPAGQASTLARAAYFFALVTSHLADAARRHPDWQVVSHERLSADHERIRELALSAGLPWSGASDAAIESMNRPGAGFDTSRVSSQVQDTWRDRLGPAQTREIRSVLREVGIDPEQS